MIDQLDSDDNSDKEEEQTHAYSFSEAKEEEQTVTNTPCAGNTFSKSELKTLQFDTLLRKLSGEFEHRFALRRIEKSFDKSGRISTHKNGCMIFGLPNLTQKSAQFL